MPAAEFPEVMDLARDSLRRRLESAEALERAAWQEMALNQRLGFVLDWLYNWSKHFSMSRVAQRIGVSRQAISKIRKGEVVPTSKLLMPLARELGISYRFLTDGTLDFPQTDRTQAFFRDLPLNLAQWVLSEVPGRRDYVSTALELARAAEHSNVDLRFLEQFLKVVRDL
ncbi:MAG: helix-turn-helix transcriptional regulator [Bacillota bacterium]|nr:helix-turn-helix transcriptional regulator [Bacillota bacterium]